MYHTGLAKEYPKVPFIRNSSGEEYPVILCKELTGRDCNKFMNHIGLNNLIDGISNTNIDFNVLVQNIGDKKDTNLAFHTWILSNINKNMCIIPNDMSINVLSHFKYTIYSLIPSNNSAENTQFIDGIAKISYVNGSVSFLPFGCAKFVLNNNQSFYVIISMIKDLYTEIKEKYDIHLKTYYRTGITLHILVTKDGPLQVPKIIDLIKEIFNISI